MNVGSAGYIQPMLTEKFILVNSGRCSRGKAVFWPLKVQVAVGCNCAYLRPSGGD